MTDLKTSEWLSLGTGLVLLQTIAYSYGYSLALDINLLMYFTLNDYFRLSIEWMPMVALLFAGSFFYGYFRAANRRGDGASSLEQAQGKPVPFTKSGEFILVLMAGSVALLAPLRFKLDGYLPMIATLGFCAIVSVSSWGHWAFKDRRPQVFLFIMIPILVAFSFLKGVTGANDGYRVVLKGVDSRVFLSDPSEELKGRVHFVLDDWIIAREVFTDQLRVVPKRRVRLIINDD